MRCVYFNTCEAAPRQNTGTIHKLGDDARNIGMGHSFWHPKHDVPDNSRHQPISDIKGYFTRRNGFPKKAPFTCTSRRLAARMAYLSDRGRTVLLTGICILLPSMQ